MAYNKQTWNEGPNGGTPLSAARLNNIENGIEAATAAATTRDRPINARDYGVREDVADVRTAFRQVIADNPGRTIMLPPGATYTMTADGGSPTTGVGGGISLTAPRTTLILTGATLQMRPSSSTHYQLIDVAAADCAVVGGRLIGDVGTHSGSGGEFGHGLSVGAGAHRFLADHVYSSKMWGDGFLIWGRPQDVELRSCIGDDNRRQGLSIIDAIRPRVLGGAYVNTGLTAFTGPGAGIDIEPDPNTSRDVIDALVSDVMLSGNKGQGLWVSANGRTASARIVGCQALGNGANGGSAPGFQVDGTAEANFVGCTSKGNVLDGWLTAANSSGTTLLACTSRGNTRYGVYNAGLRTVISGGFIWGNGQAGLYADAAGTNLTVTGTALRSNCQNVSAPQVDLFSPGARLTGVVSDTGPGPVVPAFGFVVRGSATNARLLACDTRGTFSDGNYLDQTGSAFAFPVPGANA